MTKRTDIHAPSSPDFDPQNYEFWATGDNHPEDGVRPTWAIRELVSKGYTVLEGADSSHCTHCGQAIRYFALMTHEPTKKWLYVGETCLDNRFDLSKSEFQALREQAKLNRERRAKSERIQALLTEYPHLVGLDEYGNDFLSDLHRKLNRDGFLTERQIDAARTAITRHLEREVEQAKKAAAEASRLATATPAPTGKVTVTGVVSGFYQTVWNGNYGEQVTYKFWLRTSEGWDLGVTVPSSLSSVQKGDTVTLTCTVEPSHDSVFKAFGKRPTKASVIKQAA